MSLTTRAIAFVARPLASLALSALLAGAAQAGVVLSVVGGKLTGATGVIVSGVEYDVEFVDGTCAGVFSGCDDVSDFAFTTSITAAAASQALLDTVFIDDAGVGLFDTSVQTRGCTQPFLFVQGCNALTPFAVDSLWVAQNGPNEPSDLIYS